MGQYTFRVIIEPDGRRFHAYAPALPGCHTHGKTIIEAQKHIKEAIELYVEVLTEAGEKIPTDNSFETFQTIDAVPRNTERKSKKRMYV